MADAKEDNVRERYLKTAAESGVGDAYYYLAKDYQSALYLNGGKYDYFGETGLVYHRLVEKCADLSNGPMAGYAQCHIGSLYKDGDVSAYPKDYEKAKAYMRKAISNGYHGIPENAIDFMNKQG